MVPLKTRVRPDGGLTRSVSFLSILEVLCMVILIAGGSHTGKTVLAQRILEERGWPYLSIDHLKMGLIRSGYTHLTPSDDDELTAYLWPIVREMAKTAIENGQNLVIEGCYIPFDWAADFDSEYLAHIRAIWLVMTEDYIRAHFSDVMAHASDVEQRQDDDFSCEAMLAENARNLRLCRENGCEMLLISDRYEVDPGFLTE